MDNYECEDCGAQFTEDEIQDNLELLCEFCGGQLENIGSNEEE